MSRTLDTDERWNVPISALEHYAYCPRQAILIWQEAYFESNIDTVRGDLAHAAVDRGGKLTGRAGATIWRSLPVLHCELGMHGICDTVHWTAAGPIPVEHKSGTYRSGGAADLQVAAQVMCLREMFDKDIPYGEVFAGRSRRHYRVDVDDALTCTVRDAVENLRQAIAAAALPPAVNDSRCNRCSLRPGCLPESTHHRPVDLFLPRRLGDWND
ncbi:CRISPR-associated protein Cas4 [Nocardia miyunensis]|uniref:CRISPR-associated protein Cas4 n=1 Tax=Nocardia miyunensis TaxID=282684 RepID=UPI000830375A|nr:CRISPR-associated protein Cas4 [Nocardia miyunensis]